MGEIKLGNKYVRQLANSINDKMFTVHQKKRRMPNWNIKLDSEIWWQAAVWYAQCSSR